MFLVSKLMSRADLKCSPCLAARQSLVTATTTRMAKGTAITPANTTAGNSSHKGLRISGDGVTRRAIPNGTLRAGCQTDVMPVDPAIQQVLDGVAAMPGATALEEMSPSEVRSLMDQMAAIFSGPEVDTEDRTIPGPSGDIPVRIYRPEGDGPFPVVVFFHGGGFVIGSIASHDAICRSLCQKSGAVFISVEYRLAPEHPFPAAPEDCYAATMWVSEHGAELGVNPSRLAVVGDSAGGNLAAVVCLMAKERGGPPIAFQALVYPVTDHVETASRAANAEGYLLTTAAMDWFIDHYADDEARKNPWCAPLRAMDLGGLPSALVVTAEYDPLRDEGEAYGRRLQEASVPVSVSRYEGMVHGFLSMTALVPKAVDAEDEVAQALRRMLA